ncbi:MAG: hypothetical protein HN846_00915 [Candidatus Pacebacteria bacterium]|jgi:hypothetical protein|nr:hypothetical protein [Candidatus Paceibacterota bacterium]MBT3512308.1 hypothetical protein [Candidatus Paceibacterota bacterium]MBT4004835.1 hypothetical protein [Candidatus Paceibacterota bacterium]MBT4358458.1 hypothetical protein [Candidatus Paceibacterota bacterium]MBT4681113.1 hypothetical protein [Candidatus Paceibacterota bacterium]
MLKKQQLYLTYYALIGSVLVFQVIYTIYQTSLVVAHGHQQRTLENNQQQLAKKKQLLQGKLANKTSLLALSENGNLTEEYQLISKPIIIDKSISLAAAN